MAEYTETYENVLKRWAALCGLQYSDLLTTETDLFKQFAQGRLRYIWDYTDWPETVAVNDEALTSQAFTTDTTYNLVLGVFEENPVTTTSTAFKEYEYRRLGDSVQVYGDDVPSTVYVLYKKRYPEFDSAADTIPMRFSDYIAWGCYVDWLRAEDDPRSDRMEGYVEALLQREAEKFERTENHSKWGQNVKVYTPSSY